MSSINLKHIPERSCAVCKAKTAKKNLIRLVKSPEGLAVIDLKCKLPGRGVYICPDSNCIERAKKSGALARALKTEIHEDFWPELEASSKNFAPNLNLKLRSVLGLARKSGTLFIGQERIANAENKKFLLMFASDSSESVKKFALSHEHIELEMNMQELSQAVGVKGGVQIIGLPFNSGFAKSIREFIF